LGVAAAFRDAFSSFAEALVLTSAFLPAKIRTDIHRLHFCQVGYGLCNLGIQN
jgi:hypothetical protein